MNNNDYDYSFLPTPLRITAEGFSAFYFFLGLVDGNAVMSFMGGLAVILAVVDRGLSIYFKLKKKRKNGNNSNPD